MDPVKIEKLQAMRRYRMKGFLQNLMQYCLSTLCLGLFLSNPLWLPKLRHFFFAFIPSMGAYLFCPKCFFILGNVIVIFLVGESKLSGTTSTPEIYDEYMERSKSHRRASESYGKEKAEAVERAVNEENVRISGGFEEGGVDVHEEEEKEEEGEEEEEGEGNGWEEDDEGEECSDGEEDDALPADELNRRVEDFIARVNKQRRLEARLLARGG